MKNKYLIYILLLSLITRFIFCFIYGDQNLDHEWGILVNNFFEYKTFGFFVIEGQVTPNLYMPPLYAFFLIFLKFIINELKVLLIFVFLIQSIISTISFYYLFKLTSKFYNYKISILITLLYSLFPLNFYAVSQISSIIFQSSFFIIFRYYIISFLIDKKLYYLFLASVFSGLLLLLRGEFLAIYFIFIFLVFTKKKNSFFFNLFDNTIIDYITLPNKEFQ